MKTQKMKRILEHACDTVPYYRETWKTTNHGEFLCGDIALSGLPHVDKAIFQQNKDRLISEEADISQMIWEYTSGTTGIPLRIGKTQYERSWQAMELMKWRINNFGIKLSDPYGFFTTIDLDKKVEIVHNAIYLSEIHLDDETLYQYYHLLLLQQITWMYSTPAVTFVFMNFMKRHGLPPIRSMRYMELSGEELLKSDKQLLSVFFGCTVAEQYGTIEHWSIAQECSHGKLHVMEENVYLEINPDGVYITALNFYAMPVIRYHVDDDLAYDEPCACGVDTRTIKILKSRSKEFLFIGANRILSPILLNSSIKELTGRHDMGLEQFQYIQKEDLSLTCYVVYTNQNYCAEHFRQLLWDQLQKLYPFPADFVFRLEKVDSLIPFMKNGKLGYFKSDIPQKAI